MYSKYWIVEVENDGTFESKGDTAFVGFENAIRWSAENVIIHFEKGCNLKVVNCWPVSESELYNSKVEEIF